jgi:CRP-like cAMP-binding protein
MVDDHGKMVNCRDVDRGSILGLPATLCVEPYMFTAETKTDCTFVFIPTDRFQQFLRSHPALCMEVVQLMSRELATVNRKRIEPSRCSHPDCSLRGTCSHLAP